MDKAGTPKTLEGDEDSFSDDTFEATKETDDELTSDGMPTTPKSATAQLESPAALGASNPSPKAATAERAPSSEPELQIFQIRGKQPKKPRLSQPMKLLPSHRARVSAPFPPLDLPEDPNPGPWDLLKLPFGSLVVVQTPLVIKLFKTGRKRSWSAARQSCQAMEDAGVGMEVEPNGSESEDDGGA